MTDDDYPRLKLRLIFEPRDLWVGLFWKHNVQGWDGGWWEGWSFYLTIIPMLPLRLEVDRSLRNTRAYRRWGGNGRSGRNYRKGL